MARFDMACRPPEGFRQAQRSKIHHVTEIDFAVQCLGVRRIMNDLFAQGLEISNRSVVGKENISSRKWMGVSKFGSAAPGGFSKVEGRILEVFPLRKSQRIPASPLQWSPRSCEQLLSHSCRTRSPNRPDGRVYPPSDFSRIRPVRRSFPGFPCAFEKRSSSNQASCTSQVLQPKWKKNFTMLIAMMMPTRSARTQTATRYLVLLIPTAPR